MIRLRHIGVLSAAKVSALLYGAISLLIVPLFLLFAGIMTLVPHEQNQPPAAFFVGFALLAPFIYAGMGFVLGALMAFVYNLIAGWVGGLEMQFESTMPVQPVAAQPAPMA